MSKLERYANLTAVVLPFVAFLAAILLLWNTAVGWTDLAILAFMYVITALGITVGYHRMLTHRAFDAPDPVRYTLAGLGQMAVQGPVVDWVADHRKHHAFTDEDGDPHSPHGHGSGLKGALHGLWYAHTGWLFETNGTAEKRRYARDLVEDPTMKRISKAFPLFILLGLAIPFGLGFLLTGTLAGALTGLLWGGFVRIFLVHHVTWSINSICHFYGDRPYQTTDFSTNNWVLSLISLGESWHNNHHAFPTSAVHGLRPYQLDLTAGVIRSMKVMGLAWDVKTVTPKQLASKSMA